MSQRRPAPPSHTAMRTEYGSRQNSASIRPSATPLAIADAAVSAIASSASLSTVSSASLSHHAHRDPNEGVCRAEFSRGSIFTRRICARGPLIVAMAKEHQNPATPEYCLREAEECRALSMRARSPADKTKWLHLAGEWAKLAIIAEEKWSK